MEKHYFSLEPVESNRLTRIFQLIFGIVCFIVAIFWLVYNIRSLKSDTTLWITVIFLIGFSFYQINAGLGKATRFIEINRDKIRMKRNSLFPAREIRASEIEKIEIFPLNLVFFIRDGSSVFLRFGTSLTDKIEPIKNAVANFAAAHNINKEIKSEEP